MVVKFEIPGRLPGLNELLGAINTRRMVGAKLKKDTDRLCGQWIIASNLQPFAEPVHIHFDWYSEDKRRDPDNIRTGAKFILDALVQCGKLTNDTQRVIKGLSDNFWIDKDRPRVVVTITN